MRELSGENFPTPYASLAFALYVRDCNRCEQVTKQQKATHMRLLTIVTDTNAMTSNKIRNL